MATDGTSIRAAGDNISDGRLDRQEANIAQVTYFDTFCKREDSTRLLSLENEVRLTQIHGKTHHQHQSLHII